MGKGEWEKGNPGRSGVGKGTEAVNNNMKITKINTGSKGARGNNRARRRRVGKAYTTHRQARRRWKGASSKEGKKAVLHHPIHTGPVAPSQPNGN